MRYLTGSAGAVTAAILALGTIAGAQTVQKGSEQDAYSSASDVRRLRMLRAKDLAARENVPRASGVTVEVVIKDKAYHITTDGGSGKGFALLAGTRADIRFGNKDFVAHEFMSPMLNNLPFQLSGGGTLVKAPTAAGVRVEPGQTVVLSFEFPYEVRSSNLSMRSSGARSTGRSAETRCAERV